MTLHDRGASWFSAQMKQRYTKIAEINLNCERFRTSAPGSSWRSWADKSGVWLDQVNSGPYAARGDWWRKGSKN